MAAPATNDLKSKSWQFVDQHCFYEQTGIIRIYWDFYGLSIFPSSPTGHFEPEQVPDLMAFCKANPEFHIISYKGRGIYYNSYLCDSWFYFLGKGDNNPKLAYDPGPITIGEVLEIAKFYKR